MGLRSEWEAKPAYIAVLAALIAASGFIPTFPVVGLGGAMSVAGIIVPLVGVLLPLTRPA